MPSNTLDQARVMLEKQAALGQTLTYREFASALNVTTPPVIKTCTDILEALIAQDSHVDQPILAAVVVQQGSSRIPRMGFYQTLIACGQYHGKTEGNEAKRWHESEMVKLKSFYKTKNDL